MAYAVNSSSGGFLGFVYARNASEARMRIAWLDLGDGCQVYGRAIPLSFLTKRMRSRQAQTCAILREKKVEV